MVFGILIGYSWSTSLGNCLKKLVIFSRKKILVETFEIRTFKIYLSNIKFNSTYLSRFVDQYQPTYQKFYCYTAKFDPPV